MTRFLREGGYEVSGIDRQPMDPEHFSRFFGQDAFPGMDVPVPVLVTDMQSPDVIRNFFAKNKCDGIIHLAGMAFPPDGWKSPSSMIQANILATANLLEGARDAGWNGRFLLISSGEVYSADPAAKMPLGEDASVTYETPYAASKLAAEHFTRFFKESFDVLIARPFNHIGPGQKGEYVVPSFLRRISEARQKGLKSVTVGDLSSGRDFTDVRDVVDAYRTLLEKGTPGETYNVCSGKPVLIKEIFETACRIVDVDLESETDPALLRPEGGNIRFGSADKIRSLGWRPKFSLEESMRAVYEHMEANIPSR